MLSLIGIVLSRIPVRSTVEVNWEKAVVRIRIATATLRIQSLVISRIGNISHANEYTPVFRALAIDIGMINGRRVPERWSRSAASIDVHTVACCATETRMTRAAMVTDRVIHPAKTIRCHMGLPLLLAHKKQRNANAASMQRVPPSKAVRPYQPTLLKAPAFSTVLKQVDD
jgi:hypothetical protein